MNDRTTETKELIESILDTIRRMTEENAKAHAEQMEILGLITESRKKARRG